MPDEAWIRTYGAVQGTTAHDWVSDDLTEQDLTPYFAPGDDELRSKGVRAVFVTYLVVLVVGVAYAIALGLAQR